MVQQQQHQQQQQLSYTTSSTQATADFTSPADNSSTNSGAQTDDLSSDDTSSSHPTDETVLTPHPQDDTPSLVEASTQSVETGAPTIVTPPKSDILAKCQDDSTPVSVEVMDKEKPKRNRCLTCKKRVGLTGFECRCGGLFCSMHRYSDTHSCAFNYRELAQEQIRKNNPVVAGEKVKKI